jgi:2-haloacid dehalogenase
MAGVLIDLAAGAEKAQRNARRSASHGRPAKSPPATVIGRLRKWWQHIHREEKMSSDRRKFMQLAGATAAVAGAAWAATPVAAQTGGQFKAVKALAFDAYGTLFDVFSVTALCEQLYPGKGNQLAQIWRVKQLQYSLMRSLMGRHRDFWGLTEDGLVWATKNLQLDLTADKKKRLIEAYLSLAAFPDVKPGLEALKKQGVKLAILSNGEPKMLEAAAKSAGIRDLLDDIISVEEVKIFKVSPRVYNLAPERMKVTNPELGFISANSWDINGAASAGLNTFWIQRSAAEVPEELGFQASAVVKAITDLAPLLRG